MEYLNLPPRRSRDSWGVYLFVIIIVIAVLVALQLISAGSLGKGNKKDPWSAIMSGDMATKIALSRVIEYQKKSYLQEAIQNYKEAEPYSAAYRRIAVLKTGILKQSSAPEFDKIDSPAAIDFVGHKNAAKLHREAAMWRSILKPGGISKQEAKVYAARVSKLNLGPLKQVAVAEVYERSHQPKKAAAAMDAAGSSALDDIVTAGAITALLFFAGLAGLVLAIRFLVLHTGDFSTSPRPRIQSTVLLISFIVYLVSFLILEIIMGAVSTLASNGGAASSGTVLDLILEASAMLGAYALGLAALRTMTAYTGEDMREIGYKSASPKRDVLWGLGGYAAALPFWAIALLITSELMRTVFKHFHTPQQPFAPLISSGEPLVVALVFIIGSVLAPLVEETFFRGVLYTAFRGKMPVWPAVLLSAGIFAIIHPLPGGFLPIFTLATVFALLREKTGSLLPSMVCHSLYNGILLLIAFLLY